MLPVDSQHTQLRHRLRSNRQSYGALTVSGHVLVDKKRPRWVWILHVQVDARVEVCEDHTPSSTVMVRLFKPASGSHMLVGTG